MIGEGNNLVVRDREDMQMFKEFTMNSSVLMGRKTFESIPSFLDGRKVYVASRDGYSFYSSLTDRKDLGNHKTIKEFIDQNMTEDLWVIGGGEIYNKSFSEDIVDEVYVSYFDFCAEESNDSVFFPTIPANFILTQEQEFSNFVLKIYTK